jgi:hypothetical protein
VMGIRGTSAPIASTSGRRSTGSITAGLPDVVRRATSRSSSSEG